MTTADDEAISAFHKIACAAARQAGALALEHFERRDALEIEHKGVQDLVTRADREVEQMLRERLLREVPTSRVLGEESGGERHDASLLWVVDPIDGTSNFVHGVPFWCVSVALLVDGAPCVGVVFDPVHDELFHAVAGRGSWLGERPLHVSEVTRADHAVVAYGESSRAPKQSIADALARLRDVDFDLRKLGSAALAAAWVATRRFDAFFELHLNPWDALGALVVVTEAGGRANDFLNGSGSGGDGLADGSALLVATPGIYDELATLTSVGG